MKERVSFTFDPETIDLINESYKNNGYRNKSHFVETAIRELSKKKENYSKK